MMDGVLLVYAHTKWTMKSKVTILDLKQRKKKNIYEKINDDDTDACWASNDEWMGFTCK